MRRRVGLFLLFVGASGVFAASVNSPAPKFPLLADYRGHIVLVNFWASWCAPCEQELPELNRLAKEFKAKKVRVLAINVDQDRKAGQKALKRLGLTESHLDLLWDSRNKVVKAYDIETLPSSFILDTHGIIRFTHSGFHPADPDLWRKEIHSLLK